jgi:L-fucose mutarotase
MLIGLDPILSPELLATLRMMGHGDDIAIVDGNYPAEDHGTRVIRADGHGLIPILEAVLTLLPIDDSDDAITRAVNCHTPDQADPIHNDMMKSCAKAGYDGRVKAAAPDVFYQRVKSSFAVVATSEKQLFGNVILKKGVIRGE